MGLRDSVLYTHLDEVDDLPSLRSRLRVWLNDRGVGARDAETVSLIATEAAANSLEHGYREARGRVDVRLQLRDGLLELEVHDYGKWNGFVPRSQGRGLALMRAWSDVSITRDPSGTTVVSIRTLEPQ